MIWETTLTVASHAGVFRGPRISVGREEIRAPLKTPAWEATLTATICVFNLAKNRSVQSYTASNWFHSGHYWFWKYWKSSC